MNAVKLVLLGGGAYLLYRAWAGSQVGVLGSPVPVSGPAGSSVLSSPPAVLSSPVGSVLLQNQTGTPFKVGDRWTLTVVATPNAPIVVLGSHNGQSVGSLLLGTTDASGHLIVTGSWSPADAGTWSGQLTAAGQPLPSVNFNVGLAGLGAGAGRQYTMADFRSAVERGGGAAVSAAARSGAYPRPVGLPVLIVRNSDGQARPVVPGGGYR